MLVRATAFLQTGKGVVDRELPNFLVCREMGTVDLAVLERQPRLWRQMCLDFILAGGLQRHG